VDWARESRQAGARGAEGLCQNDWAKGNRWSRARGWGQKDKGMGPKGQGQGQGTRRSGPKGSNMNG
jgi:hypothetical protein